MKLYQVRLFLLRFSQVNVLEKLFVIKLKYQYDLFSTKLNTFTHNINCSVRTVLNSICDSLNRINFNFHNFLSSCLITSVSTFAGLPVNLRRTSGNSRASMLYTGYRLFLNFHFKYYIYIYISTFFSSFSSIFMYVFGCKDTALLIDVPQTNGNLLLPLLILIL